MRARSVLCLIGSGSLLLGLAASPASAAPSGKAGCISELAQAGLIGPEVNPGRANIVAGTEGDDVFDSMLTEGVDVICGFEGNDSIFILDAGDVFLGGDGHDVVSNNHGTFIGGEGNDQTGGNFGIFDGGPGDDMVNNNYLGGVFHGSDGNDGVTFIRGGTFNGDAGDDSAFIIERRGVFNGGEGNDTVTVLRSGGTFNGGPGDDTVVNNLGGTFNQ